VVAAAVVAVAVAAAAAVAGDPQLARSRVLTSVSAA
jgi:hypothetical protein